MAKGPNLLADLPENQIITMSRADARALIDDLGDDWSDLMEALDYAQGDSKPEYRYVVIQVLEGEI